MSIVLGIDTGGTYTDGVIINLDTKEILAATKASTTHDDLIVGIRNTISQLPGEELGKIEYAALSTTLATNAIVEGRGCRVGLLLLGFKPIAQLPPCECCLLPGIINVRGQETEPLDIKATQKAIESLRDKVDAVAISGIFSIHNPEHEEKVKSMVRDTLGLPVVTAHELTTVLGAQERTVTAVLNARLISVIDELMTAVKKAMEERSIEAPVMIVKGDGSLMNESIARERPIETILSGPAASIIGSTFLGDAENGLVLDMGGTTTDIAILRNGRPRMDNEGAKVGGWRTRVNAAEANTFGLGGDSRIYYDYDTKTTKLGPMRCWPVSMICRDHPDYLAELKYIMTSRAAMISNDLPEGYFLLRTPPKHMELSTKQRQVIAA
ncbi:MAG: hydantoinase/oxoprolinase family protein, partial [Bacillota bacterium]|nr:hydantoinase/oxoprolinase family protein [Bacillota bacterium]